MNNFLVQNEFGSWVVDIFAQWLSTHALGEFIDLNPIHNDPPVDLFLIGTTNY
jgi:hypothetical protein